MSNFSPIKENILKYLEFRGISKYEFYKKTGIARSTLDKNSGLTEENIAKFVAYYSEVDISWLITGKGEMIKSYNIDNSNIIVAESPPEKRCQMCIQKDKQIEYLQKLVTTQQNLIDCLKEAPISEEQKRKGA